MSGQRQANPGGLGRCGDEFVMPGSPLSVACVRWREHDGQHRSPVDTDPDGTMFCIEWRRTDG